ncbi:regulatory protein, tetR family [Salinihabitans flavidus]|uniref:Regulatory protein, tetR family n=1 Tax=Salinihabitans flavidus TaxID=569882 RepID=A0A1H8SLL6_9RHOB|nr:hypothetical protein [Salinihabitans flavidus]SEO79254.1 regulatory protein, tetR family [Salinihabitans flavidus]
MTQRLTPEAWLAAGLTALEVDGPTALRAESLARGLGTTKGSFYWHFADLPDFHARLLAHWADIATARFAALAQEGETAIARLRGLGRAALDAPAEPALRAWALDHRGASRTLAEVDAARQAMLAALLAELGLSNPELARILYAARIGMADLSARDGQTGEEAMATLIDLVLALHG